ncbi:hypothetical protein BST97_12130 [Nonlabens spongiae]|uniref:Uncharacterized protein n=1 Tax=Nonlabens spongiae TaxID=331648 RepID=A0A1W6MM55_9FLAO|nr:hypothetical protein [Nonlabens spongiae]ARN78678.1 hypothetical protein BST97_12130 [Nonlabens spongiae]
MHTIITIKDGKQHVSRRELDRKLYGLHPNASERISVFSLDENVICDDIDFNQYLLYPRKMLNYDIKEQRSSKFEAHVTRIDFE